MIRKLAAFLLIAGIFLGAMGCGSSTGPDHGDPPSFPKLQNEKAKPDFSFFQQNQPKLSGTTVSADTLNYYMARSLVLTYTGMFASSDFYNEFLTSANAQDASYNDGVWEWKYSFSYQGQSIDIRLTAEKVANGYKWAMYWSYDSGAGIRFDNYKVFEGTSSEDGSQGEWTFNTLSSDTNDPIPAFKTNWTITSDTQKTMTLKVYDNSGNVVMTIDFNLDGTANTLTFSSQDTGSGGTTTVYWDTNTKTGYIIKEGTKSCWDKNFVNVPCS